MSGRTDPRQQQTIIALQDEIIQLRHQLQGYQERETQSRIYMAKLKQQFKKLERGAQVDFEVEPEQ